MKRDEDRSLKAMFISIVVGMVATVVTTLGLDLLIRHFGFAWHGDVFGNDSFNWKDAAFVFLSFGGFVAGLIPTKLYFDHRFRKSRFGRQHTDGKDPQF